MCCWIYLLMGESLPYKRGLLVLRYRKPKSVDIRGWSGLEGYVSCRSVIFNTVIENCCRLPFNRSFALAHYASTHHWASLTLCLSDQSSCSHWISHGRFFRPSSWRSKSHTRCLIGPQFPASRSKYRRWFFWQCFQAFIDKSQRCWSP